MRLLLIFLAVSSLAVAATAALPRPLPNHPGNIFLEGEEVVLPPTTSPAKLFDYDGKEVTARGKLPIGYYELRPEQGPRITLGVIAPLKAPTPATSPIAIDVAMAWFYKTAAQQKAVANLCNLAGINWVRDRLSWGAMEPQRGKFAEKNIYDDTARLQTDAGLRILQVNHHSPPWANPDGRRFPLDLRDAYNFYREMARRWKGEVLAIEPWNEADIDVFGGHTGSEMASMQKASYLGLKAGNPAVIASQNVFAIARQTTLDDFATNEPSAYFDTYNLHHYVPFEKYPQTYAAHRAVSGGKPMWVTECNVTVNWADEKTKEPADEALRWQANRVAKVYAMSLHEGSVNTFYFILGHYVERTLQYGIIKEDLTPRPAFVALAAAGRLLADAKPLGRWKHSDPTVHGYLFRAKPDGEEKLVFLAWRQTTGDLKVKLDAPVEKLIDHLGRPRPGKWKGDLVLTGAPVYAILPPDAAAQLEIEPPPVAPPRNHDKPADVVLQAVMPVETLDLHRSAYVLPPDRQHKLTLRAYNFGEAALTSPLLVSGPKSVPVQVPPESKVEPGGMTELSVTLNERPPSQDVQTVSFRFGPAKLSIRLVGAPPATQPAK